MQDLFLVIALNVLVSRAEITVADVVHPIVDVDVVVLSAEVFARIEVRIFLTRPSFFF